MRVVETAAALQAAFSARRTRVALVPTMGNLHAGHLRLIKRARQAAECVVASVFVNPLQFGPGDDYARYPRTLEADTAALEAAGCDLLFAPGVDTIYNNGYPPATTVRPAGEWVDALEGAHRPGHFSGVATVVAILFNLVRPDVAVFGEKDYQQLVVIRRMVSDLALPIRILGVPIVREADGLAMSSRNQYLSVAERSTAPRLYRVLQELEQRLRAGERAFGVLQRRAEDELRAVGFAPDYVAIRDPGLRAPGPDGPWVILAAARLGSTRLIDCMRVGEPGAQRVDS